ncbi:hypothetical protein QZM46_32225 [Burkholderia vietnamiensis]|jgi:hypothetical protein|uniref:Uncharacterized protein n=4 Tax=Burkholderia cepacia complex TaxID=87882 RepID=A0A0H3KK68_BURM1|nr:MULTISPECIES: hypothetical protein [Burkholderia cepacia complex]ABO57317.1 hypothetical protein Bcep1808_4346 [Burkholderia vietnamiensis G4]ABX18414.1 conserved hypothetical protein [Burkholderia multivorans ATCC 17616]AIO72492.1 hypothetical protein DM80_3961 [Burkholderia multivorans]AMU14281.1 hypothetical protein A3203_14780 [Burkholderia cenocepacia]AOK64570.1 hypothetical protein WM33_02845 [Burkholderia multivorans]
MEAVIPLNIDPFIAVGHLTRLGQFQTSKQTKDLSADFPMLSCPIAAADAHFVPSVGGVSCGMGFGNVSAFGSPLITMRLQLNGTQIYWLADLTDPEVWAAYDRWKRVGRVPISLNFDASSKRECVFCVPEVSRKPSGLEELRIHAGKPLTDYVWETMITLSTSGLLQCQATTDLPDVRLECVLVNVLVTKRLEPFVRGRLHDTKPTGMPSSELQDLI